jgi:hypothetical protein
MKRLGVMGLVCLLSACQSTQLPGQPEKTATFPTVAADFSDCVYRFAQSMRSPYFFHRITVRADKEFLVTAARPPTFPQLELRFIAQGEATTVELRDTAIQDHELSDDVWAITERCSQQTTKPHGARSTAP